MNHKTILASTYAVNPYKGSEDGMGWNFVNQIARFNKVIAITRMNNRPHIEKYIEENPSEHHMNIQFLYFDLPYWMRFWKKGSRGAMLYYWMWQKALPSYIRKLDLSFDLVHNLNFHNDWTPSYLWKLNKPFIWGPIGHHPLIPSQYLRPYHRKYWIKDRLTWIVKKYFWKFSAPLKKTIQQADFIYCMNESVPKAINLHNKEYSIMPSVATDDYGYEPEADSGKFTLISAGRLVPLKGYDLSILAFASFLRKLDEKERDNCELVIVGSGPELGLYKRLCQENGVQDQVTFIQWVARKDLMELFRKSSAFLFPSHEGAGMVVPEALSFGLPVICLDNHGPGEFIDESCGYAIPIQDYHNTVIKLGEAIYDLYSKPGMKQEMSKKARKKFEEIFHWERRGEFLNSTYKNIAG